MSSHQDTASRASRSAPSSRRVPARGGRADETADGAGGPRRRLGLRARAVAAFASIALVLSVALAALSYQVTRQNLIRQRETAAERQAYLNARLVRSVLRAETADLPGLLRSLQLASDGTAVLRVKGAWFGTAVGIGRDEIPASLRDAVQQGEAGRQRTDVGGEPFVAVGVPLPAVDALYFELVPLRELERTLQTLAGVLTAAGLATTLAGAIAGWYASGRVLRPLGRMAAAASQIGGGRLEQRLDAGGDADLEPLVRSFNEMVRALRQRIDREARFASDVSHELRAPLAAMSSALHVARRRAGEGADAALDVLEAKIAGFNQLVLDLLEISRVDAGVATVTFEPVDPEDLVRGVLTGTGRHKVTLWRDDTAPATVCLDRRRVGQMLVNLLDNADLYAGGATAVGVSGADGVVRFAVDDAGSGVPEHERAYVFERFARGERSTGPDAPTGTGLGLALVAEHSRLHHGRVWVEDAPEGGARFVIELPVEQP